MTLENESDTRIKKDIILITNLDVWMLTGGVKKIGTGNQSLYNTLLGYANHGYSIARLGGNC